MKIKNEKGLIHIFITIFLLWIPWIVEEITGYFNKDLFLACFMLSILVMVDAKMRHNNFLVSLFFTLLLVVFILLFVVLYIR